PRRKLPLRLSILLSGLTDEELSQLCSAMEQVESLASMVSGRRITRISFTVSERNGQSVLISRLELVQPGSRSTTHLLTRWKQLAQIPRSGFGNRLRGLLARLIGISSTR